MKRAIFFIIFLSIVFFVYTQIDNQEIDVSVPIVKGKVYVPPKQAPYEEFFIDEQGQFYKLNFEQASEETIEEFEEIKEGTSFVEIKGEVKQEEIIVKEIIKKEIIKEEVEESFVCPPCDKN